MNSIASNWPPSASNWPPSASNASIDSLDALPEQFILNAVRRSLLSEICAPTDLIYVYMLVCRQWYATVSVMRFNYPPYIGMNLAQLRRVSISPISRASYRNASLYDWFIDSTNMRLSSMSLILRDIVKTSPCNVFANMSFSINPACYNKQILKYCFIYDNLNMFLYILFETPYGRTQLKKINKLFMTALDNSSQKIATVVVKYFPLERDWLHAVLVKRATVGGLCRQLLMIYELEVLSERITGMRHLIAELESADADWRTVGSESQRPLTTILIPVRELLKNYYGSISWRK